jgi:hypothetical protein
MFCSSPLGASNGRKNVEIDEAMNKLCPLKVKRVNCKK